MSERPWMPFYVNDFRMATLELDADEVGVYMTMLCLCWLRKGPLPGDQKLLKKMLGKCFSEFHGHTYNRIVPKLLGLYFYQDENGDWRQKRIEAELSKAAKISAKQSQSAHKRWTKDCQKEPVSRKINGLHNASALPSQSQSQEIDKSISNKPSASPRQILSECLSDETAVDIIAHRKAKRSPLTAGAASGLVKAFREFGDCEAAAREMILRGWTGFKPEWMRETTRAGPFAAKPKITSLTRLAMGLSDDSEPNPDNADYGFSPSAPAADPGYFRYSANPEYEHGTVERRQTLADSGIEIITPRRSVGS